jgi:hypothetical protein
MRYLNNDGSKWKGEGDDMKFVLVLPDGTRKERKADWYESFGNFAALAYRYQGKRFRGLPKSPSGFDTREENESRVPHIFHEESAGFQEAAK